MLQYLTRILIFMIHIDIQKKQKQCFFDSFLLFTVFFVISSYSLLSWILAPKSKFGKLTCFFWANRGQEEGESGNSSILVILSEWKGTSIPLRVLEYFWNELSVLLLRDTTKVLEAT